MNTPAESSELVPAQDTHVEPARRSMQERLHTFGGQAIGLNRLFSGLQPLLFRTKLLALNAEIASARIGDSGIAFGVVVKDLLAMSSDLRRVTKELEDIFREVAQHVGVWIRCRTRFTLYLRVTDALWQGYNAQDGDGAPPPPPRNLAKRIILDEGIEQDARADESLRKAHLPYDRAWSFALSNRREAISNLREVDVYCQRLHRLLDQLSFVATRQSGYLATTARVEATQADQTAFDLTGVTGDIQAIAREFSVLQQSATDAVLSISKEADLIFRAYKASRRSIQS